MSYPVKKFQNQLTGWLKIQDRKAAKNYPEETPGEFALGTIE